MATQITTIEAAFAYTGRDIAVLEKYNDFPEKDRAHLVADYKLKVAIEALNKESNNGADFTPKFDGNNGQRELWAWIKDNPNGVGFVVYGTYTLWANTDSDVGSRFVLRNIEVFENLRLHFQNLIEDSWTK